MRSGIFRKGLVKGNLGSGKRGGGRRSRTNELLVSFFDHCRGQQVAFSFLLNEKHSEQNAKAAQHLKPLQPFSQPEVGHKPGSDWLESRDYRRPSGSEIIYTVGKYAEGDNGADADRVKY